MIQEHTQNI